MLEHGGNLRDAAIRFGRAPEDWIDLSTGINPQWYPVPPLALPDSGDPADVATMASCEAVALFIERARAISQSQLAGA